MYPKGGSKPGSMRFFRVPHGLVLSLWVSLLLPESVVLCREREGCCVIKASKSETIQSIRLVFLRIFDCFISLKKEKVAFLIFADGSVEVKSCLER